jgi:hypothetical protein
MNVTHQLHRTNMEYVLCPLTTLGEISIVQKAITVKSIQQLYRIFYISPSKQGPSMSIATLYVFVMFVMDH